MSQQYTHQFVCFARCWEKSDRAWERCLNFWDRRPIWQMLHHIVSCHLAYGMLTTCFFPLMMSALRKLTMKSKVTTNRSWLQRRKDSLLFFTSLWNVIWSEKWPWVHLMFHLKKMQKHFPSECVLMSFYIFRFRLNLIIGCDLLISALLLKMKVKEHCVELIINSLIRVLNPGF